MSVPGDRRLALAVLLVSLSVAAGAASTSLALVGKTFAGFLPFVDASVGNVDQPSWPGVKAGLRYLDQVVAADGQPVRTNGAILEIARRAGDRPIRYTVQRGVETLEFEVAPIPFSWGKLAGSMGALWLMGLLLALLAVTIAWVKPRASFTPPFTLTCLLASFIFFGDIIGTASSHAWVFAVGFYLMPAAIAHLGLTFPETRSVATRQRWLVPALWAACVLEFIVYSATLGTRNDPTTALHLFTLGLLAAGAVGLILNSLWTVFRSTSDLARTRARLLAIAMAGPLITVLAMTFAAKRHASIPFNVAAAPLLLFLGTIGFGISNNDVFEVDQVFRRSARALLAIFAIALSALFLDRALRALLTSFGVDPSYSWIPLGVVVLLAFDRVRSAASWVIERLLYPRAQELRDTAHRSRTLFGSANSADEIVEILFTQLQRSLGLLEAALLANDANGFTLRRETGNWMRTTALAGDDRLVVALQGSPHLLGVEELQERQQRRNADVSEALQLARLRQLGARLAIPLHARGGLLAILLLGQRRGREPYNSLEERLLAELALGAALALDDAIAYEKLAAFSHGLEMRVEERTRQLQEANQELTRAIQFKSEFIRSVSHELRTPLIAVTGFTELVLARGGLPAQSVAELGKVQRNAHSLLLLIEDLLDLGRIEAGKFPLHLESTDLGAVMRDAVGTVEPMALERKLALRLELGPEFPPLVQTDAGRVRQILVNLLGNAVKFTPQGEVALIGRVEGERILLEVRDSGPGIPADKHEAVFGEFVQLGGSDARGTGLGLGIARRLARLLGGDITLRSEPGSGSCFTLILPGSLSSPLEVAPLRRVTRRTLVALSEQPELLVQLRELVAADGFDVVMAFDTAEVVANAKEKRPFAVALDASADAAVAVEQALREALGEQTPPAVLLQQPLEKGALLARFRQLGWEP